MGQWDLVNRSFNMRLPLQAFTFLLVVVPTFARSQSIQAQSALDVCPPNHVWVDGCAVDVNLCQIACPKGGSCTKPCETEVGLASEDVAYDAMTAAKCSELCETSKASAGDDEHRCRFWRYDMAAVAEKRCTLLTKCDTFLHCPPEAGCQCGDVGCPGEEPNDEQNCTPGTEFHPSADNPKTTYIRWACAPETENPYSAANVAANTFCMTTHKCSKWTAESVLQDLQVTCDGTTGHWKAVPEPIPEGMEEFYTAALGADGSTALVELDCAPVPENDILTVNVESTSGLIRCEDPDPTSSPDYRITAPNTCILLCDFHLGMTIKGYLNEEGNYVFKKVETDEDITQANVAEMIKCW